jgi:uncharacterized protein YebE (UPF0316 family)
MRSAEPRARNFGLQVLRGFLEGIAVLFVVAFLITFFTGRTGVTFNELLGVDLLLVMLGQIVYVVPLALIIGHRGNNARAIGWLAQWALGALLVVATCNSMSPLD